MNIDRIAREMVDVEPSADLEARIRARVRAAQPGPTTPWWVWRVAMPAAAAAVVMFAIVVRSPRPTVINSETTSASAQPAGAAQPASTATAPAVVKTASAAARVVRTSSRQKPEGSVLSAEELAWMERRMPALDPVNALHVDRLGVESIQPEPLAITPLTMTPVTTEGAGTGRNDR
jgi:hypothetical protein